MKRTAKLVVCLGLAWGMNAQAASVTYYLDQSNALLDGIGYVKVTVSDSTTNAGDIDFKVETTSAFSTSPIGIGTNFGLQAFGFNPTMALSSSNIYNLNTSWSVGSGNLDGFGSFSVAETGTGNSRLDPLTFSINIAGDSISSYANPSTGTAGSWFGSTNPFFAAHVAGFTSNLSDANGMVTSAYFAGSTTTLPPNLVPVPAAAWLLGSGLIGLVGLARRKAVQ
ncbi:VPLPA-CTERM sorting domain-containing protein [Sulfurirhabdus autotrophica]|uniref:Putative secreted protein n=1 Tax=Sulfurirhabdus autotrophica TaxID=1706046 RepID=A0A4R3YB44_9PROT|nr:VPLPA-CTERM sorting domain-containing protein [Sulfurirhabdus autotrophica]TCV88992.1 putative secreted protein [Sulfurirhabdus autotrophica]